MAGTSIAGNLVGGRRGRAFHGFRRLGLKGLGNSGLEASLVWGFGWGGGGEFRD